MKLKFRASGKDFLVFLIFALVLLYLVALAVLNFYSLRETNTFHGFNPFPAFTGDFLPPTMVFYLGFLIAIISSVKSYFFEVEKGVGFTTKKKDEGGYSRWATNKEMKAVLSRIIPTQKTTNAAGVPLINNGKEIWVDDGEYHNLIIGSTGSGKTQAIVNPLVKILAKKGESMIVTDPKGEIYEENVEMLKSRGYNVVVLNFRDPQRGNAWNPLNLPYSLHKEGNRDKANELLDDLALNILYEENSNNQDPFWENTAANYFVGLALGLFDDADPDQINLNSINLMSTVGEEKYLGNTYINEYFSEKDKLSPAYINVVGTLQAASQTKASILSVFKQKISLFSSRENIAEMLSHNDFDMKDIGRQKTAVFIVIQDEKKTYHSLVTIFIKQCYETLIDVAQESGGKLPYRTNFILDEFANMPPLKDVTTMVTAARSRAIRFSFIIQNFSQLYQVYGKENGETIKGNCGNIIYLISSELSALEEISKMAGEVKSKEKEKTASKPLITVSDLQRLKEWEIVVLRTRMLPFKTKITPNYKMDWGESYPKGDYPLRDREKIEVFDIKDYVERKNKEMMENAAGILGSEFDKNIFNPESFLGGLGSGFPTEEERENMLKIIDAKIAELEAEEERLNQSETESSLVTEDLDVGYDVPNVENLIEDEISQPLVENNENKTLKEEKKLVSSTQVNKISTTDVTDDQFFDDFFFDDDE